jgi:chromosome segregation ATPase
MACENENCPYNFGELLFTDRHESKQLSIGEKIEVLRRAKHFLEVPRANISSPELKILMEKFDLSLEQNEILRDENRQLHIRIAELMDVVSDQNRIIQELQRKAQENRQRTEALMTRIREHEQTIQNLNGQIIEKDQRIAELQRTLEDARTQMNLEINRLIQVLALQQNVSADLRGQLEVIQQTLDQTRRVADLTQAERDNLRAQVDSLSTTFNVTKLIAGAGTGAATAMCAASITGIGVFLTPVAGFFGAIVGAFGASRL